MKHTRKMASLVALICLLGLLAGCSSGGGYIQTVGTDFVPNQIAAGLYLLQWSQIIWGLAASQTGTQDPVFGDPVFNPDGTMSQSYTGPDGTTTVMTFLLDGTMRLDITYADGGTQTVVQGIPEFDGISRTTIPWEVTADDGTTIKSYTISLLRESSNADLSNLVYDGPNSLSPSFSSTVYFYTTDLISGYFTFTPTAEDENAAITVDGEPVSSGSVSQVIDFVPDLMLIDIVVTAEDGVTTKTYSVYFSKMAT